MWLVMSNVITYIHMMIVHQNHGYCAYVHIKIPLEFAVKIVQALKLQVL